MTEIVEGVSVGQIKDEEFPCPFCEPKPEPGESVKIELADDESEDVGDPDVADDGEIALRNNSGALARRLGNRPFQPIVTPASTKKVDISKRYRVKSDEKKSRICGNAHHLIPGNASLRPCDQLLKWMAGTVEFRRVRYKKLGDGETPELKSETKEYAIPGGSGASVKEEMGQRLTKKSLVTDKKKTVSGKVYGSVDFDLNEAYNGVWLPGNNAVNKWKTMDSGFQEKYANEAMNSTAPPRQFHDAHEKYSDAVLEQLNAIAEDYDIGLDCLTGKNDCKDKDDDGNIPAPRELKAELIDLAADLQGKLVGSPEDWARPWVTSERSLDYKSE